MTTPDRAATRAAALTAAIETHLIIGGLRIQRGVAREETVADAETAIRRTADTYAAWIEGTTRLRLIPGPVVDEASGTPSGVTLQGEEVQINTGQKFSVTVDTEDAAGYDTPEQIEWSINDDTVASITVSEDTRSCEVVSGAPGSAVLTAKVVSMNLSATLAVDVVPAGTATIELVPGEVVDETPAEPAPEQ